MSTILADYQIGTSDNEPIVTHAPTRPMDVLPEVRQTQRMHYTICSIYPAPLRKQVRHNGITIYQMPAAPRGSYTTLRVYDTQEWCARPDPTDGRQHWLPMPIPALIVAQDLVATWAGDTLGKRSGFSPGIGLIQGDKPTPEELSKLRAQQSSLFNWFITDAMGKYMKGLGNEITDIHRLAAKEMLDKGAERLPWYPTTDFAAVKNCVACGKQVNEAALRCDHCTTVLPDWYEANGMDTSADPVIADFIAKRKKSKFKPTAS
jgi:hypothetical protein